MQAISDASAKIKWAVELKPNLTKLSLTKVTSMFLHSLISLAPRSDNYSNSVSIDIENKQRELEDSHPTKVQCTIWFIDCIWY